MSNSRLARMWVTIVRYQIVLSPISRENGAVNADFLAKQPWKSTFRTPHNSHTGEASARHPY
jgi:hypothetical protein